MICGWAARILKPVGRSSFYYRVSEMKRKQFAFSHSADIHLTFAGKAVLMECLSGQLVINSHFVWGFLPTRGAYMYMLSEIYWFLLRNVLEKIVPVSPRWCRFRGKVENPVCCYVNGLEVVSFIPTQLVTSKPNILCNFYTPSIQGFPSLIHLTPPTKKRRRIYSATVYKSDALILKKEEQGRAPSDKWIELRGCLPCLLSDHIPTTKELLDAGLDQRCWPFSLREFTNWLNKTQHFLIASII